MIHSYGWLHYVYWTLSNFGLIAYVLYSRLHSSSWKCILHLEILPFGKVLICSMLTHCIVYLLLNFYPFWVPWKGGEADSQKGDPIKQLNTYMMFLGQIQSKNFSSLISTWNNMICLKLLVCKFVFIKMVK